MMAVRGNPGWSSGETVTKKRGLIVRQWALFIILIYPFGVNMKKRIAAYVILLIVCASVLVSFVIEFFKSEEVDGYVRQYREEQIAELYLQDIQKKSKNDNESARTDFEKTDKAVIKEESIIPSDQVDLNYTDDNYEAIGGVKYTPDYAAGRLDCVLEIPKIKMRRGVYTGTASEIQHDLDIWMTTTAHTDYVLGETHYCIYGHNSPTQSLSFNDLKNVGVGDIFLLTTEDYVFLYDVTDFFPQWRELVKKDITDNFSLPADKCFIITCGRDQYRYKDIVVEGTLREKYTIAEWNGADQKGMLSEISRTTIPAVIKAKKIGTNISARLEEDRLQIQLSDEVGNPLSGAVLCITDSDGLFLKDISESLITDENGSVNIPTEHFSDGVLYAVGVLEMDTEQYEIPADQEFRIVFGSRKLEVSQKEVEFESTAGDYYMILWICLMVLLLIPMTVCIIQIVRLVRRKERK